MTSATHARAALGAALGLALVFAASSQASAQRQPPGSGANAPRRPVAGSTVRQVGLGSGPRSAPLGRAAIGRTASAPLRGGVRSGIGAPDARIRARQTEIARAQRVLASPRASADARRAAGLAASEAFHAIGEELEARGDRAGAAAAFSDAATVRWGRNDADMRFRSTSFARAARLQSAAGDRRAAATTLRRAAESLDRLGTERDQLEAARLYREEADIHAENGDVRAQSDALVSSAEAMTRAGHIVTADYQSFTRGAPSTWPESEHVLRARAHDHFTTASRARDDANRGYRTAGLSWWSARQATRNPRDPLPEPTPRSTPDPSAQ